AQRQRLLGNVGLGAEILPRQPQGRHARPAAGQDHVRQRLPEHAVQPYPQGMAGAGLQGRSHGKNLSQERREDPRTMKTTVAALSLFALAACSTMQEGEGPSTAFRLTSPGMPDNSKLPAKAAGNFAKNPNCTGQNVSPAIAWSNAPKETR